MDSNKHISWGTKGDNTAPMDLGVTSKAKTNEKGVEAVEVELEDELDLIDKHYDEALDSLLIKPEIVREVSIHKYEDVQLFFLLTLLRAELLKQNRMITIEVLEQELCSLG